VINLNGFRRNLQTRARRATSAAAPTQPDAGSRFSEVWSAITSDPYEQLPQRIVGPSDILSLRTLGRIYRSAQRTLQSRADLLPPFDKLVHPVGICMRGTWRITECSRYTGYFRQGSEGLLIARASDNMGENRPSHLRFLGLAGKLYPTRAFDHLEPLHPADFVMNENLIGSHTKHFVDATLATDLLPFHMHDDVALKLALGFLVASVFAAADRVTDITQSLIRQLYPIAELGELRSEDAVAPAVMRFVSSPHNRRVATPELREELQMKHHPDGIRYEIHVADRRSYWYPHGFVRIGEVHFTEATTSCTCDHRLHFRHAPYRHPEAD
jgi:hypothetical protein